MKTRTMIGTFAVVALGAVAMPSEIGAGEDRARVLAKAVESKLAGMKGVTMFVTTDKPLYHPGETVWFRAFELATKTLTGTSGQHGITFQLIDPGGAKMLEKRVLCQAGVAMNDFELPDHVAGGSYTVRAVSDLGKTEDKPIVVSAYELPQVKKTLEFRKKSYSPGEEVTATATLERATGEVMAGAKTTAIVKVDDKEIARFVLFSSDKGKLFVRFQLPLAIQKGEGSLTLMVDAGGQTESIQRRIPILLDKVDLAAYPEGGDLVTGLEARVYVQARDTLGKPADVEGSIVDDTGAVKARFKSFHAGMARVELEPQAGRTYRLEIKRPGGKKQELALPAAKASGCTMQAGDDFRSAKQELSIEIRCTDARKVVLTGVLRENLLAATSADVKSGAAATLALPLAKTAVGAVRVTLWDDKQSPLAERLVFRGLGSELRVSVVADRPTYAPRDPVALTVKTTDGRGEPVAADLALAVVDDTVLSYADDKSGHILSRLYLEPEMPGQKVFEPNFYFSKDQKAAEALDLVMGTQGWRRFEWKLVGG